MRLVITKVKIVLFTLFGFAFIASCDDDLPKETQDGRNTFGMLVNGEKWETSTIGSNNLNAFYYPYSNSLLIKAKHDNRNEDMTIASTDITKIGEYIIRYKIDDPLDVDSTRLLINGDYRNSFILKDQLASSIVLTKFDTINKIISGTFTLNLINKSEESLVITEGRFDIDLIIPD